MIDANTAPGATSAVCFAIPASPATRWTMERAKGPDRLRRVVRRNWWNSRSSVGFGSDDPELTHCQSQGLWNVGILERSLHDAWRQGAGPSTGRAMLTRKSDGAVYRILAAMLTAMHSADSLTVSHARCAWRAFVSTVR